MDFITFVQVMLVIAAGVVLAAMAFLGLYFLWWVLWLLLMKDDDKLP